MEINYAPPLEESVEIEAPVETVWDLVKDVRRMAEWSPQVESTRLADGITEVGPGVTFTNANSHGELTWKTHGTVVRFTPCREIAFRIEENWAVWSFQLEETDHDTTVLTQRRETPDGISDLSLELTEAFMGGTEVFTETMRAGMRQTLAGIRATALAGSTDAV
ncbi:MAG TPA: SRPBCC family protein [Trebonia sp.]